LLLEEGNLKFYGSVPLQTGSNFLTVAATLQDGSTLTKTITVNRIDAAYVVNVNSKTGLVPHPVQFSVIGQPNGFFRVDFDFDGNGQTDFAQFRLSGADYTYRTPGIYRPRIDINKYNYSSGRYESIYQQTLTVAVFDPAQLKQHLDQVLRSVWNGMNSALLAGDIPKALTALSPSSRDTYGQIFEALRLRIAVVVNESSEIEPIGISTDIADYAVLNVHGGKSRVFIINFIQAPDGIWRIDSM
jgi:hypothetical protein